MDIGPSKIFLLERGDKPEKGGVDVEMGGGGWGGATFFTTLQFSSNAFTFLDFQSFELAMQDFSYAMHAPCSHPSLVLKPGTICTFPIHSGSLQKMLTAYLTAI